MTDRSEGFLSRWSRLKRRGEQPLRGGAAPQLPEQPVPTEETDRAVAPATQQDLAPGATAAIATLPADPEGATSEPPELPSIESLNEDSDYSVFMNEGVPEDLKRLALRKLWRLTPGIRDGLDDYDDDYTITKMVGEAISGAVQIGRELSDPDDEAAVAAAETTDDRAQAQNEETVAETEETTDAVRELVADPADSEDPRGEPGKA